MAGEPLPIEPLEPLAPLGAGDGRRELDAAGAAELFALAWFGTGGHDARAARAVTRVRDEFARSHHGVVDARLYALTLLVPRTRRLARRVRPAHDPDPRIDAVLHASVPARLALALRVGAEVDDATGGQLLGVDPHEFASFCRHALGAARFVGVPEVVRARFDELVARALRAHDG